MKAPSNFIISPRWLATVVPRRAPLENYSVVVQAGKVSDILAAPDADQKYRGLPKYCLLYTSPSPRDRQKSRMPSSA